MLKEIGNIRISHNQDDGYHLVVDLDDVHNRYEGLESYGDTFQEALEDLIVSVETIDGIR